MTKCSCGHNVRYHKYYIKIAARMGCILKGCDCEEFDVDDVEVKELDFDRPDYRNL